MTLTIAEVLDRARAGLTRLQPVDLADHSRLGVQSGVLSPGNQVVFSSPLLTRGTYDLECFISDDRTGMPHFFMGMHKIVVVR